MSVRRRCVERRFSHTREVFIISRKKTNEEFLEELAIKRPTIEPLEPYQKALQKMWFRCKVDGYTWQAKPADVLHHSGCRVCGYKKVSSDLRIPFEDAKHQIEQAHPTTEAIEYVFEGHWKVHCRCKLDGYEWSTRLDHVLQYGCAKCAGNAKKTTAEFAAELAQINPHIEIVGEYTSRHKNIRCRCRKDGYEWCAQPGNLLAGWGCPKCGQSRGERRIEVYLKTHGIEFEFEHGFDDCRSVRKLLFDFYIPSMSTIVEYDGEQHFFPVKFAGKDDADAEKRLRGTQERDAIKNEYCATHGLKMIRIPYTEYDHIEEILDKQLL